MITTIYGKTYEWDEESAATLYNITDVKYCLFHNFVNASLHFGKTTEEGEYSISLQADRKPNFNPEWGTGYGGIRFCTRCKKIDCIHLWEDQPQPDEAWKTCDHEWLHPNKTQWKCRRCGAQFNWMCGCGGSMYVCDKHYQESYESLLIDRDSRCWGPSVPNIKTCRICQRRIKTFG